MTGPDRPYRALDMTELIERSSLGTPEVRAARDLTPLWVRHQILANLLRPEEEVLWDADSIQVPPDVVLQPCPTRSPRLFRLWRRTT